MTVSAATLDCNIAGLIDLHHRAGITRIAPHLRLCPAPTWTPATENPEYHRINPAIFMLNGTVKPEIRSILETLAAAQHEINATLITPGSETRVVIVKQNNLTITAARTGDTITLDAYIGANTREIVDGLAATINTFITNHFPATGDREEQITTRPIDADTIVALMRAGKPETRHTDITALFNGNIRITDMVTAAETPQQPLHRAEATLYERNHENPGKTGHIRATATEYGTLVTHTLKNTETHHLTASTWQPHTLAHTLHESITQLDWPE